MSAARSLPARGLRYARALKRATIASAQVNASSGDSGRHEKILLEMFTLRITSFWQGRCRDEFLRQYAPGLLSELQHGLSLITSQCSCSFAQELFAFDQVTIRMELRSLTSNRMVLGFEYLRENSEPRELVATGQQELVCMRRVERLLESCDFPQELVEALRPYMSPGLAMLVSR